MFQGMLLPDGNEMGWSFPDCAGNSPENSLRSSPNSD
jgi:hypothetical protein